MVFGISQSARFIHHFIFEGFNSDRQGRIVFDGAIPHVGGAGKGNFNFRFAQTIQGIALPKSCYTPHRLDFGDRWLSAGIFDKVPPERGEPFRTLVPAVDVDGNEVAGIRLPDVAVPLATYAGWNVRGRECGGEGLLSRYIGSRFPFPRTAEQRRAASDPRPAITERYPTRQSYLDRVSAVARRLQQERFLLEEDVKTIQEAAESRRLWDR